MKLKFTPPLIFPHRCYLERGEEKLAKTILVKMFGEGGSQINTPPEQRWLRGQDNITRLKRLNIAASCYGEYYGFRTADDAVLFFMKFQGTLKK